MKSTKKFSLLFIVSLALTLLVIPSCTENDKEQKKETSFVKINQKLITFFGFIISLA